MSRLRRLTIALIIPLCLSACSGTSLPGSTQAARVAATAMDTYDFEVSAGFVIASVDESDKELIDDVKSDFEKDLRAGRTEDYVRDKDFSVQLLSGSEGNYFTSPEFLQGTVNQVLATLVVIDGEHAGIFKGQFDAPRFVFADPDEEFSLDDRTKAYLLTADGSFAVQTYKGELVPDSELDDDADSQDAGDDSAAAANEPANEPADDEQAPPPRARRPIKGYMQPEDRPLPRQPVYMQGSAGYWGGEATMSRAAHVQPGPVMVYGEGHAIPVPGVPSVYARPAVPIAPMAEVWGDAGGDEADGYYESGYGYASMPYADEFGPVYGPVTAPRAAFKPIQDPATDPFQANEPKASLIKRRIEDKLIKAEKRARATYPAEAAYPAYQGYADQP